MISPRNWTFASLAAVSLMLASAPAIAQAPAAKAAVDAAKAQGLVGEQGDGFLGFVVPPNPAVAAAVNEINAGRAQVFRDIAMRTNVTPEVAGAATAQQLLGQLPAGFFYRMPNGTWMRK